MKYMLVELAESCDIMPDEIFKLYDVGKPQTKCFYNLVAECYKDIQSYCVLMSNACWTQAGIVLRTAIERISSFIVMMENSLIDKYIEVYEQRRKYILSDSEGQKRLLKEWNIENKSQAINNYFDYGWAKNKCKNGKYCRDEIIRLASFEFVLGDIKETFNKFAHNSLSIFQYSGGKEPWENMKIQGERMNMICIVLFQRLYICTRFLYNMEPIDLPVDNTFTHSFRFCNPGAMFMGGIK